MSSRGFIALLVACCHLCGSLAVQMQSQRQRPLELSKRVDDWDPSLHEPLVNAKSQPPIMMVAHGCSMTSAGIDVMRELLYQHGVMPSGTGRGELIKTLDETRKPADVDSRLGTFHNDVVRTDAVVKAKSLKDKFQQVYNWAEEMNQTLVFKNEMKLIEDNYDLVWLMKRLNTSAFFLQRTNLIDLVGCYVKDFCAEEGAKYGTNVDSKGNKIKCGGFRGRGDSQDDDAPTELMQLFPDVLLEHLQIWEEADQKHLEFIQTVDFRGLKRPIRAEDLFAFEFGEKYDPEGVERSTTAWMNLLMALRGVHPQEDIVRKTLLDYGTFPAPDKHSDLIYNIDEVKEVLNGTKYYQMLRL